MPQRGITVSEVENAMQSLLAAGRVASVRSVRHALGDRGSLTTIAQHIRVVRARDEEAGVLTGTAHGAALPDPVVQGLLLGAQRHWSALNDAAEAIVAQAQARATEEVEAAQGAERNAKAEAAVARAEQEQTARALRETQAELEALQATHATLTEEHRSLGNTVELTLERQRGAESLADERRSTLENTTAALARAESELETVRGELDQVRAESTARERDLTRRANEAEVLRRGADEELLRVRGRTQELEAELERERASLTSIGSSLDETRRLLEAERLEHARTAGELAIQRERCEGFRQTLAQSEAHSQALAEMLERVNERVASAETALRTSEAIASLDRDGHENESG